MYSAFSEKDKITLKIINENKAHAGVTSNSVLMSVAYLGFMTNEEFLGEVASDSAKTEGTCTWINNEDYGFMSECGNSFFNDDGTIDWMNYCPYCGGKAIEQGKAD